MRRLLLRLVRVVVFAVGVVLLGIGVGLAERLPIRLFLVHHPIERAKRRLVIADRLPVAVILQFAGHVVVRLVEELD
ncbi:hypothetical protein [Bradyrhizobium sp. sBnM-33]|uniref:hypothetical protein n=1 Tax=Bradyrhizobium sp. sBnM-33 TaxID=2831780 RepID=UPI001BCB5FC3|nr:hypothetical protein [Bradyrhizobium sp. sBnM-33]WOH53768.1 hypothetical protein RX328_17760 [Bradyrhizobium sp. sBnM-33]